MDQPVLEVRNVSKSFPGVKALENINLEIRPHEIVGLVGENGAGKSTLLKILIGAYQPDSGEILVRGQPVSIRSISDAAEHGLAMVFQEQSMLPNMTVREHFPGPRARVHALRIDRLEEGRRRSAPKQLDKVEIDSRSEHTHTDTSTSPPARWWSWRA